MKRFQRRSRKYCPEVRGSFGHQLQIFIWKWLKENKAIFVIEYPSVEGLKFRLAPPPPWPPSLPSCCTVPYFSNDPLLNLETCKTCANKMLLSRYLLESEFFTQNLLSQQFISSSRHFSEDRHILCASMKKIYL